MGYSGFSPLLTFWNYLLALLQFSCLQVSLDREDFPIFSQIFGRNLMMLKVKTSLQ
jgi:hypothetical protein